MICIARTLGAPERVPAGSTARSASIAVTPVAKPARDLADDMEDVRVGLDDHQLVDLHRPVLADPAEVVSAQVDEHHVLGPLLRVAKQLLGLSPVLLLARPARVGARRSGGSPPAARSP